MIIQCGQAGNIDPRSLRTGNLQGCTCSSGRCCASAAIVAAVTIHVVVDLVEFVIAVVRGSSSCTIIVIADVPAQVTSEVVLEICCVITVVAAVGSRCQMGTHVNLQVMFLCELFTAFCAGETLPVDVVVVRVANVPFEVGIGSSLVPIVRKAHKV
jgi:hypothetical protein